MDDDPTQTIPTFRGTSLEVGVDAIDREHAHIFEQICRLELRIDATPLQWRSDVGELCAHHQTHFDAEERLLKSLDFRFRIAHQQTHQTLLCAIKTMESADDLDDRRDAVLACRDRLVRHIIAEDMRYKWFVYEIGRSDYDVRDIGRHRTILPFPGRFRP